ncbi:MAG TPA: Smr/MutS family protein [Anaeromyxobacter sp.]|nr:Smr/MutS family protein [Anaeromyxobacter sp.]
MRKRERPFNDPFQKLSELKGKGERGEAADQRKGSKTANPAPSPLPAPPPATDLDLWAEATRGVRPVDRGAGTAPPKAPRRAEGAVWHPDLEAIDALRALISGDAPFDISDSDEFIEGRVTGLDQAIVTRLRRGEFAIQGHLDLHGMTREEARGAVNEFLRRARQAGKRCVLLVHGRGTHSKDQLPVLKEALSTWLSTHRFGRHVLAFATARPADGGAGAVYVLLRRAGR